MENTLDDDGQKSYSEMDGKSDDDNGEKMMKIRLRDLSINKKQLNFLNKILNE